MVAGISHNPVTEDVVHSAEAQGPSPVFCSAMSLKHNWFRTWAVKFRPTSSAAATGTGAFPGPRRRLKITDWIWRKDAKVRVVRRLIYQPTWSASSCKTRNPYSGSQARFNTRQVSVPVTPQGARKAGITKTFTAPKMVPLPSGFPTATESYSTPATRRSRLRGSKHRRFRRILVAAGTIQAPGLGSAFHKSLQPNNETF